MPDTVTVRDGTEVHVEHVKALAEGGARFDVASERRRWRIDVERDGTMTVVTTWEDGQLADLDVPDWLEDLVARLRHA